MTIADEIKQSIKMDDLFRAYGLEPNRAGFVICPFHSEKTASLKAYADNTRFKCFGCGAQGDVISFVMQYDNLTYQQALIKLNNDFSLNLVDEPIKYSQRRKMAKTVAKRHESERRYEKIKAQYRECNMILRELAPQSIDEPLHPLFIWALHNKDRLAFLLDEESRR